MDLAEGSAGYNWSYWMKFCVWIAVGKKLFLKLDFSFDRQKATAEKCEVVCVCVFVVLFLYLGGD